MNKRSRTIVVFAAGLLTAAAAVFVTVSASAATKAYTQRIVSKTVEVAPKTMGVAQPRCAADEVNTGGGYAVAGTADPSAYTVFADRPDTANGWNAAIFVADGYEPVDLIGYAVCIKRMSGAALTRTVVTVNEEVPAGETFEEADATCPQGYVNTAGGYLARSLSTTEYVVDYNGPGIGAAWRIVYHGPAGSRFAVHAVCIKKPMDVPLDVWNRLSKFSVPGQSTQTSSTPCNADEILVGGGWLALRIHPNRIVVRKASPHVTQADGHFWKLTVYSDFDESEPLPMWSYARCINNTY